MKLILVASSQRRVDNKFQKQEWKDNLQTLSLVINPRGHRTPPFFPNMHKGKHRFKNRDKVRFAEKLEAVHELPSDSSFYRNLPFGLHLPEVQKYTPLVCRDPYAKPSKKKNKNEFGDMFLRDTTRLPFISLRSAENCVEKVAPKGKEMTSTYETRLPKPGNRPATITSDKRTGGNIIHFKYSDFMLTKIDRKSPSKGKLFVVKY